MLGIMFSLSLHSLAAGYLNCFYWGIFINILRWPSACEHQFKFRFQSFFQEHYLDHMVILRLALCETAKLFPMGVK